MSICFSLLCILFFFFFFFFFLFFLRESAMLLYGNAKGQLERNRDSSPTRQLTDMHFEDRSPTELKTVHRQI